MPSREDRVGDGSCSIAFTDEGPGIPAELREKIFTAFFTTKARGTGLGLATAKRLIEAHRGDIQVECPQGGGTTFTVSLPMEPGEVGMMSAQHSAAHSSTS